MGYSNIRRICPFFESDDRTCIRCEGGTRLRFPDFFSTSEYTRMHCASYVGWKQCTVAIELLKYYDRLEAEKEDHDE